MQGVAVPFAAYHTGTICWKGGLSKFKIIRAIPLSDAAIRSYAESIDAAQFPYFCAATGELAESLSYVIRTTIRDFIKCGVLHCWKKTSLWQ